MRMRRPVTITACLALAALPIAGCGDDDDGRERKHADGNPAGEDDNAGRRPCPPS